MTQQPSGPTVPGGDRETGADDIEGGTGHDQGVTPGVAGPSGTGEATDRGGDPDAAPVSGGSDPSAQGETT